MGILPCHRQSYLRRTRKKRRLDRTSGSNTVGRETLSEKCQKCSMTSGDWQWNKMGWGKEEKSLPRTGLDVKVLYVDVQRSRRNPKFTISWIIFWKQISWWWTGRCWTEEEETKVKKRCSQDSLWFGYFTRTNIDRMNTEWFCERTLSWSMILSTHWLRPGKLESEKNYVIRLKNKFDTNRTPSLH